jgi:hypothetical protein
VLHHAYRCYGGWKLRDRIRGGENGLFSLYPSVRRRQWRTVLASNFIPLDLPNVLQNSLTDAKFRSQILPATLRVYFRLLVLYEQRMHRRQVSNETKSPLIVSRHRVTCEEPPIELYLRCSIVNEQLNTGQTLLRSGSEPVLYGAPRRKRLMVDGTRIWQRWPSE